MAADNSPTDLAALASHVDRLGVVCPWTRQQKASDMMYYLRSEILEVEKELRQDTVDGEALSKELGDVLFDALMLIEVAKRDHPKVSLDACTASACAKLRRRCPYIFDGPSVSTIEEAEAGWQAAKRAERDEEATVPLERVAAPPPPLPPSPAPAPVLPAKPAAASKRVVVAIDDDGDGDDGGLDEWERDFRRGTGPPSESDGDDDD